MGGRVAFLMAAATKSFKAAVDFYGGGVYSKWGTDRPAPSELAANISCPIQGHFGELDTNPPPDEMRTLDAELRRLGKEHEFFFYADAPHGFNRSGWKGYKPDHDAASWARTLNFFAKHLTQAPQKKAAAG
jgi:carboxymethylenebutenolidase